LLQQSAALPLQSRNLSTVNADIRSSTFSALSKRGFFGRKKRTKEEEEELAREKVLLSHGRGLKSKDLKKLSDEDFHTYMSQHISRLDHVEASKLAKHLERKAEKHSYTRAKGLDAMHAQLKKHDVRYKGEYENAHWAEDYAKTAEMAKDKNPTIDDLHKIILQSQHKINRLHDASKSLNEHVKNLGSQHKWERQQEGKDIKKSTSKKLKEAQDSIKRVEMYPNVKTTFEKQEAKKAEEAEKARKEAEEKAQKKANKNSGAAGWPLPGKIGSFLGYKSPSKSSSSSSNDASNNSQSSPENSQYGRGKVQFEVGEGSGSSKIGDKEGSSKGGSGRSSTSDDEGSSSGSSSGTASQSGSPTSVIPGYTNSPRTPKKVSWSL
jgi:hypothetical protein